jgi:hypothetical protein
MGVHPLIAAMIHAMPPTTAVIPAKIPKFLASVGVVTKIAAVVKIAATVQGTAAIILYALELTLVTPSSLTLSLWEIYQGHNDSGPRCKRTTNHRAGWKRASAHSAVVLAPSN